MMSPKEKTKITIPLTKACLKASLNLAKMRGAENDMKKSNPVL
jgi:hypothetical protein